MTDLRTRLADALREHRYLYIGVDKCAGCSWEGVVARDHDAHLADVLLSLDDIVTVDAERHRRQLFDLLKGIIDGEWGPYEDDHYWLMVDEFLATADVGGE